METNESKDWVVDKYVIQQYLTDNLVELPTKTRFLSVGVLGGDEAGIGTDGIVIWYARPASYQDSTFFRIRALMTGETARPEWIANFLGTVRFAASDWHIFYSLKVNA